MTRSRRLRHRWLSEPNTEDILPQTEKERMTEVQALAAPQRDEDHRGFLCAMANSGAGGVHRLNGHSLLICV